MFVTLPRSTTLNVILNLTRIHLLLLLLLFLPICAVSLLSKFDSLNKFQNKATKNLDERKYKTKLIIHNL